MDMIEWFVGVDWGSEAHQVCIIDGEGSVRGERSFTHTGSGLDQLKLELPRPRRESISRNLLCLKLPINPRHEEHVAQPSLDSARAGELVGERVADRPETELVSAVAHPEEGKDAEATLASGGVVVEPGERRRHRGLPAIRGNVEPWTHKS